MLSIRNNLAFCLTLLSLGCTTLGDDDNGSSSGNAGSSNPGNNSSPQPNAGSANGGSGNPASEAGAGGSGTGDSGAGGTISLSDASIADAADAGEASEPSTVDGGVCAMTTQTHPSEGGAHVNVCSQVTYGTNPPSSGNHYPNWAAFGVYQFALPRGFWVHNMEHGAVVISYNCPEGCDDELAALTTWFNALPVDAACQLQGAISPRALLVPDPSLDVRFAGSAWLHTLRADCFDAAAFTEFYDSNVGHGLEAVCTSGTEFRGPDGNPTAALPANCGQ